MRITERYFAYSSVFREPLYLSSQRLAAVAKDLCELMNGLRPCAVTGATISGLTSTSSFKVDRMHAIDVLGTTGGRDSSGRLGIRHIYPLYISGMVCSQRYMG